MRETWPDDIVVSFANAKIAYYGIMADLPLSAPKSDEFGSKGENSIRVDGALDASGAGLQTINLQRAHINGVLEFANEAGEHTNWNKNTPTNELALDLCSSVILELVVSKKQELPMHSRFSIMKLGEFSTVASSIGPENLRFEEFDILSRWLNSVDFSVEGEAGYFPFLEMYNESGNTSLFSSLALQNEMQKFRPQTH